METKDVFISYKTEDFTNAQWVKNTLESNGISCWMAPDCIPGGSSYASEIPRAIRNCKVFVLILSSKAQISSWVPKELDQAINENKVIMPFMIENCTLTDAFNFYLSNVQRFAAYENQSTAIERLIREINAIIGLTKPMTETQSKPQEADGPIINPTAELIKKVNEGVSDKPDTPVKSVKKEKVKNNNKPFFKLLAIIFVICAAVFGLLIWNDGFVFKTIWRGFVFITPFDRNAAQDAHFRYPLIIYTVLTAITPLAVLLCSCDYKNSFVKTTFSLLLGFAMWYVCFWLCGFIVKITVLYTVLAFIASLLSGLLLAFIFWITGAMLLDHLKNQENQ